MKKMVALAGLAVCLFVGNTTFAQGPGNGKGADLSPEQRAEKRTEKMKEELDLTAEQTEKIAALNLEHMQEMEALRKQMEALRQEMKAKRDKHKAEVDKVLTPEQKQKHDEKMKEMEVKKQQKKKDCEHQQH